MPLDANIALGFKQPDYPDPMKMYGNMLAIQNAGNQNALAQYQLSSAKRADADQESLRRLPAGATLQQQQDALRAIGKYKEAAELEKASLEGANTQAQINERKMIAAEKGLAMYGTMMGALASNPTPENFQATVQNVKNMGLGLHAPAPSDISQLTQWARSGAGMSKQGLDAIEAYKQKPTVMGGKIVQTNEFAPEYLGTLGDVAPTAGERETARHNPVMETNAAGQLAVSQGNLDVARGNLAVNQQRRADDTNPALKESLASAAASGTATGTAQATAKIALPKVIDDASQAVNLIDQMIGDAKVDKNGKLMLPQKGQKQPHPGFGQYVGIGIPGLSYVEGTDTAGFKTLLGQVKGGAFLQAYDYLRGTGSITEIEGTKATNAATRMDKATSEAEFVKAAREYQDVIRKGVERAKTKANVNANPHANKTDAQIRAELGL